MTETTFQIVVSKGPNPGQRYPLITTNITIGRDPMADIVFNDPEVSRQHVTFNRSENGYTLTDLGSTNGTFINGDQIGGDPIPLTDGDEIALGSGVTLLFQMMGGDADSDSEDNIAEDNIATADLESSGTFIDPSKQAAIATDDDDNDATPPPDATSVSADNYEWLPEAWNQSSTPADTAEPDASPDPTPAPPPLAAMPDARQTPLVASVDVEAQRKKRRRNTTVALVSVLLLICCCLTFLISGYFWWGDLLLQWLGLI